MAFPALAGTVANIKPASFFAVYVKPSGEKWQTLGSITGGELLISDYVGPDSQGRNRGHGAISFSAKCKMKQCSLTELELLDSLCNGTNAFLFKMADAVAITTGSVASAGWIGVTAAQVGVKAKVVMDGTPENNRMIELEWAGSIRSSDANEVALYTPTLIDTDFEDTNDTGAFHAIGTYTAANDGGSPTLANQRPCGISTVTFDVAGGSSPVTIGPVQNTKFSLDMLTTPDDLLRPLPQSLEIGLEFDWMATLNADLLLLGNVAAQTVKAIVTLIDGVIFTFDDQTGIQSAFDNTGDMDKPRVVRFTLNGKVLQSSLDGIVST